MPDQCPQPIMIGKYVYGKLSQEKSKEMNEHLCICDSCYAKYEKLDKEANAIFEDYLSRRKALRKRLS